MTDSSWSPAVPGFYLKMFSLVAGLGIAIAMLASRRWSGVAAAGVAGIASFMVGGLLGFLFGIPRYAASLAERELLADADVKYKVNTNLEQISDWLTKIIVGVALTQFSTIGNWIADVADRLGNALMRTPADAGDAVALGLLLLTFVCGFMFFYIWARVYLPKIFKTAEAES